MKITCPDCGVEFKPYFSEGFVLSPERDPDTGEQLYEEEYSCTCPHCHRVINREEINESEQMNVDVEIAKLKYPEIFEDQEDVGEQDNGESE